MSHLELDLWSPGHNTVTAMPISPNDTMVFVVIEGKVSFHLPISEYTQALNTAQAFARRIRKAKPIVIKVIPLTLRESIAMGFMPPDVFEHQTPAQEEEMRQIVRTTCLEALHNSPESAVRAEALALLQSIGGI